MTKTLNQIICFFLHQNQNIFFSNIGNHNIFLEKKHNPTPPFKLNGRSLNIEQNIKRARRTTYSLMVSGLHGHNGLDPETSLQLVKTYVPPILLYGMEILPPKKTHTAKMDLFQKKILKQILPLSKNALDCAVYILTGIWPIELQIQYKALIFYNNILKPKR